MPADLKTYTGGIVATNAHLLTLPGGTLLVDAPEGTCEWLEDLGVNVTALLLTHHHFDHASEAAAIQARYGCPVHAWAAFSRSLTLEDFFGAMAGSSFAVPPFKVDVLLQDQATLQIAGLDWQLYHIPGHSADSLCYHSSDLGLLFGGDVLFRDGLGRTDFPGGSHRQLLAGIETHLRPLPGQTQVYPGHGPSTTLEREFRENPFLMR